MKAHRVGFHQSVNRPVHVRQCSSRIRSSTAENSIHHWRLSDYKVTGSSRRGFSILVRSRHRYPVAFGDPSLFFYASVHRSIAVPVPVGRNHSLGSMPVIIIHTNIERHCDHHQYNIGIRRNQRCLGKFLKPSPWAPRRLRIIVGTIGPCGVRHPLIVHRSTGIIDIGSGRIIGTILTIPPGEFPFTNSRDISAIFGCGRVVILIKFPFRIIQQDFNRSSPELLIELSN